LEPLIRLQYSVWLEKAANMVKALEANGFFDDKFSHQKRDKVMDTTQQLPLKLEYINLLFIFRFEHLTFYKFCLLFIYNRWDAGGLARVGEPEVARHVEEVPFHLEGPPPLLLPAQQGGRLSHHHHQRHHHHHRSTNCSPTCLQCK
jgi:hypothetical protein